MSLVFQSLPQVFCWHVWRSRGGLLSGGRHALGGVRLTSAHHDQQESAEHGGLGPSAVSIRRAQHRAGVYRVEVWYTNGPGVLVIDSLRFSPSAASTRICRRPACAAWSRPSAAGATRPSGVWTITPTRSSCIMPPATRSALRTTAATPARCGTFSPVQRPGGVVTPVTPDPDIDEEPLPAALEPLKVTVTHSEDAGTQILCQQDSLDYCSMTSSGFSSEQLDQIGDFPHVERSSSGALSSLTSSSSMLLSTDFEEADRPPDEPVSPEAFPSRSATDPELAAQSHTPAQLKALNIIPVNSTIWVPRYDSHFIISVSIIIKKLNYYFI